MTYHGTSHFQTFADAVAYYRPQDYGPCDVEAKIRAGEITIAQPPERPGERLELREGRWFYATPDSLPES